MKVLLAILAILVVSITAGVATDKAQASNISRALALNNQGLRITNQSIAILERYSGRPCYAWALVKPKTARLRVIVAQMRSLGYPARSVERKLRALRGLGRQMDALCY